MEKVTTADGSPIAYEKLGNGPPLVMIHGGVMDHTAWGPVVPLLAAHFTLYLINQRGRGGSGPYTVGYTSEQAFADIAAVVDAVGEPVYLLGHSMGARNALHAALLTPNVRKMALYEPPPFDPLPAEQMQRLREALAAGNRDQVVTIFLVEQTQTDPQAVAMMRQSPMWPMLTSNAANVITELTSFDRYRFDAAAFQNLHIPTLMLLGGASPAFMKEQTELINAALPNSRIMVLEGQRHTAFRTVPDMFAAVVTNFFTPPLLR